MNISRRQLYAAGEPLGECVTERGPQRGKYGRMGGGGGGGETRGVTYTSNIPEFAQQPFMDLVGKSEALSNQPYQPYTGPRIQGFSPMQGQSFTQAQGLAGASFTNPGMTTAYMSPYMQSVVDVQKREAMRDAGIAQTQRNAQAVKAGAFGGSRQAIMDAEANRNLMTQMGDIQAKGLQSAFEAGRNQYNTEFGQQMDTTQMLNTLGGQQQALGQKQLDQQYSDFQAQRDYPYQQLGFLSDILRGTSGSTRTMYTSAPQPSGLQTLAGLGTAAAGFGKLFKEGGEVKGYAAGGIADAAQMSDRLGQLSDNELQQYTQMHRSDPYVVALALSESRRRQQLRAAAAPPPPPPQQGTVIERGIAAMADPLDMGVAQAVGDDDFKMADGGIVGYADGGETDWRERTGMFVEGESVNPLWWLNIGDIARGGKSVDEYYGLEAEAARKRDDRPRFTNPGYRPQQTGLAQAAPMPEPRTTDTPPSRMPTVSGSGSVRSTATGKGLGAFAGAAPDLGLDAAEKRAREDIEAANRASRDAAQADVDEFDKDVAARGVAGQAKEARIKEQQAGLGKKEEQAKGAALLQAGLAILSADPSRGGWAAIGQGALQGLSAYKGDMKDLEATRDRLLEQMDQIDELRRQESIATGDKRRQLRGAVRRAEVDGAKALADLSAKMGLEVRPKAALETWKELQANWRADRQASATERAASIRASDGGPEDKSIKNAEAGFARDIRAAALKKRLENPILLGPGEEDRIIRELQSIQDRYYRQHGVKMVAPSSSGQPPAVDLSKWGKPSVVSP